MKSVTVYETTDGQRFEDWDEAHKHEKALELAPYLDRILDEWDGTGEVGDAVRGMIRDFIAECHPVLAEVVPVWKSAEDREKAIAEWFGRKEAA